LNTFIYKDILDNLHEGIYILDANRIITLWNHGAELITGFKCSEVIGRQCSEDILIDVGTQGLIMCKEQCPMKQTLQDGRSRQLEAYLQHKEGYRLPVRMKMFPIKDESGCITGVAETFTDISPKVLLPQKTRELARMGLLDPLTKLGNRAYIELHLRSRLREMKQYRLPFGIAMFEIDSLQEISDNFGREAGKQLRHMVTQTILNNIRFFDIMGRWDGERYMLIILNIDESKLDLVANKLRLLVAQSHAMVSSRMQSTTISVGATMVDNQDTVETLVNRATEFLAYSQRGGRNRVTLRIAPSPHSNND